MKGRKKMQKKCERARGILLGNLQDEIVGPGSECSLPDRETEVITDLPENRYYVGVLYPQNNQIMADNDEMQMEPGGDDVEEIISEDEVIIEDPEGVERNIDAILHDINDDSIDEVITLSTQDRPSSIGMTFMVNEDVERITVSVSFATYRKTTWEDCVVPYNGYIKDIKGSAFSQSVRLEDGLLRLNRYLSAKEVTKIWERDTLDDSALKNSFYKLARQCGKKAFRRVPHNGILVPLIFENNVINNIGEVPFAKMVVVKNTVDVGKYAITVMLLNDHRGSYNGTNTIFQPQITISSQDNENIQFVSYENSGSNLSDLEECSLALLYRNNHQYATGHGTAAKWDISSNGRGTVSTDLLPIKSVAQVDFDYALEHGVEKKSLSIKYLSDLDSTPIAEKCASMRQLVNAYQSWIDTLNQVIICDKLKVTSRNHIAQCGETLRRMKLGLDLLEKDSIAANAFGLANRAMFMQMVHRNLQNKSNDIYPDDEGLQNVLSAMDYYEQDIQMEEYCWRPFQLAFLLMNFVNLSDPNAQDRDLVDLIWFPTGGGKTEAYLGATAFTIFNRKLRYLQNSAGTAVIMRYTLRLLTSQQFSRASTLICACEFIRKDCEIRRGKRTSYPKYALGKDNITIGLWIGGEHTPNKNCGNYVHKGAREYLNKLDESTVSSLKDNKDRYNKFQVLKCPWCGTKLVKDIDKTGKDIIGNWGYRMKDNKHFFLCCTQAGCAFKEHLPIQVVDEELYINPPTLLFATVDKFAMMTWKADIGKFFAMNTNNRTPELIIQDELHLISGPLGSIVGLYETAIDELCSHKGIRPKIIASTATIRRAEDQCWNLYNRQVRQFPAPGLDASNSFFAKEADLNKKPGRMYVGIMPFGKTKAMLEAKVMSTLLQYTHMLQEEDEVKDQYWTLTAYFNSLRDLGKCSGLVDDDIKDFMKRLCRRLEGDGIMRKIATADELTSRVSTTKLNETLDKLENTNYSKSNQEMKKYPVNVLLATNMISVGVDVPRLNLMTVVGQPKLTSEYIQATSRVGRSSPGLVCVLYDATKSRDRSHYEQFQPYHDSFYKFVEPTSVTPFSGPARDRALHAVVLAIIRHKFGKAHRLLEDKDARNFNRSEPYLQEVINLIVKRVSSIFAHASRGRIDESEKIKHEIEAFWDEWAELIEDASQDQLFYGAKFIVIPPGANQRRLIKPFANNSYDRARDTLTSMRNVDQSIASHIIILEEQQ